MIRESLGAFCNWRTVHAQFDGGYSSLGAGTRSVGDAASTHIADALPMAREAAPSIREAEAPHFQPHLSRAPVQLGRKLAGWRPL